MPIDTAHDQLRIIQKGEIKGKETWLAETHDKQGLMQGGEVKRKVSMTTEVHDELSDLKGGEIKGKVTFSTTLEKWEKDGEFEQMESQPNHCTDNVEAPDNFSPRKVKGNNRTSPLPSLNSLKVIISPLNEQNLNVINVKNSTKRVDVQRY